MGIEGDIIFCLLACFGFLLLFLFVFLKEWGVAVLEIMELQTKQGSFISEGLCGFVGRHLSCSWKTCIVLILNRLILDLF